MRLTGDCPRIGPDFWHPGTPTPRDGPVRAILHNIPT